MKYKYVINPNTGNLQLVLSDAHIISTATTVVFKEGVATVGDLPTEGNTKNDGRIVNDTHHLYIWDGSAWQDQGDILDIGWASIENKPVSAVADIDEAVSKKHTQNTDTALRTNKFIVDADGKAHINTSLAEALKIGNGETGIDYYLLFDGNDTDGKIIWQTVKNKFKFDCGVEITGCGHLDEIKEYTPDAGVTIEGVLLKDGKVDYGLTYVEDETVSTTTNTAWQQKLRMNFTPPFIGDYLLEWSLEISNSKITSSTFAQIELDDITQINHVVKKPGVVNGYANYSGFKKLNFADTNLHTIDVDFKTESDTAMIRKVRVTMRKI